MPIVSEPIVAPTNITSNKINETTYKISWDPLPRETSNGEVKVYEVKQTTVSSSRTARSISDAQVVLQNTTETFAVLSGLKSCSEYSVEVRAYTSAGPGVSGSLPRRIVTTGRLYVHSIFSVVCHLVHRDSSDWLSVCTRLPRYFDNGQVC